MDRGAWPTTVHGVTNTWTSLSLQAQHYNMHTGLVKVKVCSCVQLFATPWTVAYQAPLSVEFSRQEYWSGLPFPSPGDFPESQVFSVGQKINQCIYLIIQII